MKAPGFQEICSPSLLKERRKFISLHKHTQAGLRADLDAEASEKLDNLEEECIDELIDMIQKVEGCVACCL